MARRSASFAFSGKSSRHRGGELQGLGLGLAAPMGPAPGLLWRLHGNPLQFTTT
jgi:hypothetical protein